MKLVPFYLTVKNGSLHITKLSLFLSQAGKKLWESEEETLTKEELLENYLYPNDLHPLRIHFAGKIVYIEIDSSKTKLNDFYTWEEAMKHPQKPECWRNYYFCKDSVGAEWFSGKLLQTEAEIENKSIHIYYEDILRLFT